MTGRSKIIGLTRHEPEDAVIEPNIIGADDVSAYEADPDAVDGDQGFFADVEQYSGEYDELTEGQSWTRNVAPALFLVAAAAWTIFFGWVYFAEVRGGINGARAIELISSWALPVLLVAVAWLIVMRNSRREADRFGDAARLLRNESEALELRLRTVNEEIAMAREFLAQNARELESVGRQSAKHLVDAAEQLSTALSESDAKAKTLETVSNAATTNLDQLRKHLPVVTSAAKDVTNQIAAAGHSAQEHIETLGAALGLVNDSAETARSTVEAMDRRTLEITGKLADSINRSSNLLNQSTDTAEQRAFAMAEALEAASRSTSEQVERSGAAIDAQLANSGERLEEQIAALQTALEELAARTEQEDGRISATIARISEHVEDSAARISNIDTASTDRAAKLAFAISALNDSTDKLGVSLVDNQENADLLLERSERLILSLERANGELDLTLPTSIDRLENRFSDGMAQLDLLKASAAAIDGHSDEMLTKLTALEHLLGTQRADVERLMSDSDAHFAARHEQADALAGALLRTRELLEDMAGDANDRVVASLLRVRETTRQAAESSKQILDEELASVAERLSEQNRQLLSDAVDKQIATLGDMVREAIDRNIDLSQESAQKISAQLAEIDEMTSNLEQRLEDSRAGFDGIDHESFARQMAMLTESLNSTSIDVAKILSNEVTDTSWAAYLKGDRGVFTRRAVKLLDAGESRAIASYYEEDAEFREHVNRYIHDFEAMMRVLLSTRDGNAIGVTLLSSDVGKLYVALAQAIERLRN